MGKFSVKIDFGKIIRKSTQILLIFCSFMIQKKKQKINKIWVGKDFQKWFYQKSVFTENFLIKFWTSLKNDLHGKNQFPDL